MSFTAAHLYFDDVEVGQEWTTQGRTLTESDIVNFAGLSGDFNPMHVDHAYAATTPYRKPIAHGLLVFSIATGLSVQCPLMRTQAFTAIREWHFRAPVYPGDTIRMVSKVLEKTVRGRGRRGEIVWQRSIVNQDNKVVQEGVLLTLVEARSAKSNATARQ